MVIEYFKRNNFPFGTELKFPLEFELQIHEANQI
jgi:hypothetical protein